MSDPKPLTSVPYILCHYDKGERISGANINMRGDCTGLHGDCSGLRGDCSDIVREDGR